MASDGLERSLQEKLKINPPKKGVDINIEDYRKTILDKMLEMRNNMGRRRR